MRISTILPGKKTYITALGVLLGYWGAYFAGDVGLADAVQMSCVALIGIFLRAGQTVEANK